MIKFQKISWKNFLATGNYWIEIPLDEHQTTLIYGKNGCGKSTILDAICFALFGSPFRKINKPTVVNSINKKECEVHIQFMINETQYLIKRGIGPALFELYVNGEREKKQTSTDDLQEHIEHFILKFNKKSFTQIVIAGSASYVPFMELTAADRRLIIEDLLDIGIFSTMHEIIKERVKTNKEEIAENKLKLESAEQRKEMQESHIKELQQNRDELMKQYQEELDANILHNQTLQANIQTYTNAIEKLTPTIAKKRKTQEKIRQLLKMEAKLEQTIARHQEHATFFTENETCPTCTQVIDDILRNEKKTEYRGKLQKVEDGLAELRKQLISQQHEAAHIETAEEVAQNHQTAILGFGQQISMNEKYNQDLNKKMAELASRATGTTKEEDQLRKILEELKTLEQTKESLMEEKQYLDYAATLLKDTGIKSKIIKQYIPVINALCNQYLAKFDFFVNFHLDENFKETIKSRHRDDFVYHSFSEGQKMRILLALIFTWRAIAKMKHSIDTNLFILDEIFESALDADGTDELIKILNEMKDINLIVISPKGDIMREKFSHTIKFFERQNFSYMEQS